MIKIFARPLFRFEWQEEWTLLEVSGEHAESISQIVIAQLLLTRHEVQVEDEDGEMVSYGDEV